jgi:hypothetical protein
MSSQVPVAEVIRTDEVSVRSVILSVLRIVTFTHERCSILYTLTRHTRNLDRAERCCDGLIPPREVLSKRKKYIPRPERIVSGVGSV